MPARRVLVPDDVPEALREGVARLEAELDVPREFPPEVLAAAERAAADPRRPELDLTGLEFVTIDPASSLDLDQAVFIVRAGEGYRVHYAIADVAAFVTAEDPIDVECHRRGETLYAPNRRIGLHPPALSEDAASLLPDAVRPALVWQLSLDARGECTEYRVRRALVRSRAKLDYEGVQADLDSGAAGEPLRLLREVGLLRERAERDRGGVSLPLPDQEVHAEGGRWRLSYRTPLPVEGWNAQISLLTGMAAARIMLEGKIGILRTLPAAEESSLRRLRTVAAALGLSWPGELGYPEFVRSLDPSRGPDAAMLNACTLLFRGAGYTAFDGEIPEHVEHAALAVEYAHTTAPLRRLVDRYVGEVCLALSGGVDVPRWARDALATLPEEMARSGARAGKFERGMVDLTEALVLSGREGQEFEGTIVSADADGGRGRIALLDPAVEANITGAALPLGQRVTARLASVDLVAGQATFTLR